MHIMREGARGSCGLLQNAELADNSIKRGICSAESLGFEINYEGHWGDGVTL